MSRSNRKNLIPGIEGFVERTLEEQGLTPEVSIQDFIDIHHGNKHRYATLARSSSGQSVIFYARLHNNEDARQKFLSDISFLEKLGTQPGTSEFVPQSFGFSTKNKREWFIREFISTPALGTLYHTTRRLTIQDAKRFAPFFVELQHIPNTSQPHLKKRGADFSIPIMEGNFRRVKDRFTSKERNNILSFIHSAYSTFDKKSTHPVHGDCHPGNVLYDVARLYLIDWETVHLNLRVSDLAYFYAGLEPARVFRKELLASFEKQITWKKEFQALFPLAATFYALGHLYTLSLKGNKEIAPHEIKKVRAYCIRIVKNSIKGYTELRKV